MGRTSYGRGGICRYCGIDMQTLRNLKNAGKTRPVILGAGLPKTGTTSLRDALTILGWRVKGYDHQRMQAWFNGPPTIPGFFNAFRDLPWCLMYDRFEKVILTVRDPDEWFDSLCRHAAKSGPSPTRARLYGYELPDGHKDAFVGRYLEHNETVKQACDDLLVVDWTEHGWDELCEFLDVPIPDEPFPHSQPHMSRRLGR